MKGIVLKSMKQNILKTLPSVPKKYTNLKSYAFVLRTDKSLNFVSFVSQDLNLNFET